MFAALVTGTFVVERIFAIPGMGRFFNSIATVTLRDYRYHVALCVLLVLSNLAVDITYGLLILDSVFVDRSDSLSSQESARRPRPKGKPLDCCFSSHQLVGGRRASSVAQQGRSDRCCRHLAGPWIDLCRLCSTYHYAGSGRKYHSRLGNQDSARPHGELCHVSNKYVLGRTI